MLDEGAWYAVVNPHSAGGCTGKRWPEFLKRLEHEGYSVEFEYTSGPGDATDLTRKILQAGYKHIISVGGDGTMNEVVNGFFSDGHLINSNADLALLSHGTGGDFIRSLMMPKGIEGFLKILRQGYKRSIDVGEVQFKSESEQAQRYFLNVADVGLGGETVARVNQQNKLLGGKLSFLLGAILSILHYRNKNMVCVIDGKDRIEGRLNSIMVANGRYFGGGMMIAPNAEIDDGFFDVIILGDFSTWTLLKHLPKIYRGEHLKIPGVTERRGGSVAISSEEKALLDIDGEQPGQAPVTFIIHRKLLQLWG
ncbi:diacylglycerol/lipid kinase family protein [Desulfosporosinus sp. SB140]|uniref:diacylglycerol/lipid kinase family protein n=1 Tax=Desulfosporosinus paludis TaxID=3115649 RepID=UPI00388E8B28